MCIYIYKYVYIYIYITHYKHSHDGMEDKKPWNPYLIPFVYD